MDKRDEDKEELEADEGEAEEHVDEEDMGTRLLRSGEATGQGETQEEEK